MFLRFWRDLAVDVSCYSCWWSELVLWDLRRLLLFFHRGPFELVEGQQSYKR